MVVARWDLDAAHRHSENHRTEVLASWRCGCFHCTRTFEPEAIAEWVDAGADDVGQTALCPRCGIDAVLGSASGLPLTQDFLATMRRRWFGPG